MKYKAGDRVRIKKDISKHVNTVSAMEKWQGKTMTIQTASSGFYKMLEDIGDRGPGFGWSWNEDMIEGLAEPIETEVLRLAIEIYGEQDRIRVCLRSLDRLSEELERHKYGFLPTLKRSLMDDVAEACVNLAQLKMMLGEKEITESVLRKTEQLIADLEDEREVEVVHGRHKINGRKYTWINPDGLPVEIGGIAKAETSKGAVPIIVVNVGKKKLKEVKRHKKVVGVYADE